MAEQGAVPAGAPTTGGTTGGTASREGPTRGAAGDGARSHRTGAGRRGRPSRYRAARTRAELAAAGSGAAVAGLGAGAVAAWWSGPAWHTPALVLVASAGTVLAVVDARTHRLPDAILLPAWAAVTALLGAAALGAGDASALVRALAGGALAFGAYAALRLAHPPGLGFGDVKLAGLLGVPLAWLGWPELAVGLAAPFVLGGAWAAGLVALRRATRSTAEPFGPFMVAGAALAAVLGDAVAAAYAPG